MREIIISPFVFLIKLYQKIISPALGVNCRFNPTIRDSPWGKSGDDPVP